MFTKRSMLVGALASLFTLGPCYSVYGEDWLRFRGPNGSGVSKDATNLPVKWSPTENIKWKVALPGPGSSSPIVVGDKIFVTSWSGYGVGEEGGEMKNLKRHLVCLNRADGKILWDKSVPAVLPEDEYGGMFAEHGYASHTPVSDGKNVYAFFGKSGVYAYDLEGKELWNAKVGDGLDPRNWGSSASPILADDKLIVTASAESETIFAFDKATGKQLWQYGADGLTSTWGTPIVVETEDKRSEIVIGVPNEIWAFNPETGDMNWYSPSLNTDSFCSSVVEDGGVVFAIEGRGGGSVAVKVGGKDDVSKSRVVWSGSDQNRIGTPLVYDGKLYFFSGGIVNCIDAKTGKKVYEERLAAAGGAAAGGAPAAGGAGGPPAGQLPIPNAGGGGGAPRGQQGGGGGRQGGGRGGRGGRGMGGQNYSSPVAGDGKLYYVSRGGDMYVIKLGEKFEMLSVNRVTAETEDFSSTPAIVGSDLLVRSSKYIYCISGETK